MEEKEVRAIMCINAKGGTGKTLLAINLALELSRNYKVGLIDLDVDSSNIASLLGLKGEIDIDDASHRLIPIEYNSNLKVIAMSLYYQSLGDKGICIGEKSREGYVREAIKAMWNSIDYLVFDMPGGTAIEFKTLCKLIPNCRAVIVTQPNTIEDCNRVIDLCNHFKIQILGVVENMSGSYMHGKTVICSCGCGKEFTPFAKNTVREKLPNIEFLGSIPLCQEIFESSPPLIPKEFNVIQNIIAKVV